MVEIFYTVSPHLHRMARKEDGVVTDLDFEIPGKPLSLLNSVYLGRVVELQKPLSAAFVEIGESQLGMLPLRESKLSPVIQGEAVLVQVNRTENPSEGKGVRLTRLITLSLGPLLYTPLRAGLSLSKKIKDRQSFLNLFPLRPEEGLVIRHGVSQKDPLLNYFLQLRQEWEDIQRQRTEKPPFCISPPSPLLTRILRSLGPSHKLLMDDHKTALLTKGQGTFSPENAFDEHCEEAWDSLFSTEIPMAQGGSLSIEETKGLVVIDVNSQGALKHALTFNRLAIKEALRQLRLRDLGGKIVMDLIGKHQDLTPLLQGLTLPSDVEIFGLSPLNLLEMIRRRKRLSLPQRLKFQVN